MGFHFRKSIKLPGGFRVNLSKKGIGVSAGVKGFRVTKTADGKTYTTTSIPGTGLYSRKQISGGNSKKQKTDSEEPKISEYQKKCIEEIIQKEEKPFPYEHISFYLEDTQLINEDGTKRQDVLYKYKMRKPPFEKTANFSILSDTDTPDVIEISINDWVIGKVPVKDSIYINENWDRVDCVSALDVEGPRGTYDAKVHFRFFKPGMKPESER